MRKRPSCSRPFPTHCGCRSSGACWWGGCHNVRCMEAGTGQSQSTISQHLMRLKAAGVVRCERQGNEMYYEVSDPDAAAVVAALFGDKECDYNCPMTLRSSEAVRQA